MPEGLFSEDVNRYVAYYKSAKPITPGGEILTPGEPEQPHAPATPRRGYSASRRYLGCHRCRRP